MRKSPRQERFVEIRRAIWLLLHFIVRQPGEIIRSSNARAFLAARVTHENRRESAWLSLLILDMLRGAGRGYYGLTEFGKQTREHLDEEFGQLPEDELK